MTDPFPQLRHFTSHDEVETFNMVPNTIWIFDLDRYGFWWGNESALRFWDLDSVDQLVAKDLSSDSPGIRRRIAQTFERAVAQGVTVDPWTTYPDDTPKTVHMYHRAVLVGPERHRAIMAFISEEISLGDEPEHLLFVEAMRYTSVRVTSYFADGAPVCQNPAAGECYGVTARDGAPPGTSVFVSRFADPDEGRGLLAELAEAADGRRIECLMNTLQGPRRHSLDIRLSRHPLTGDRVIVVCEDDVTELREAVKAAEAANEAKSAFLAVMSHELRTPLNAILGFTETLLADPDAPGRREMLEIVQESGKGLLSLLNDILDLSKIEAGEMRLDPHPVDLAALVDRVAGFWRPTIRAKGLDFTVDARDLAGLPPAVGDGLRIRQILSNLLSNAVKFTEVGGIVLRARRRSDEGGRVAVRFEVADTGIGIPPDAQEMLFRPFTQADTDIGRKYGGSGLGLNICRMLAGLMGGAVDLESAPGKGSTFGLDLALDRAADGVCPSAPDDERPDVDDLVARLVRPAPLRILVAEDNLFNQRVVDAFLAPLKARVTFVDDGAAAVDAVRDGAFDLVLMDSQMPGTNGIEATRAIRALDGPMATVPIIALTANIMAGDRERYIDSGMDDHIGKPIEKQLLFAAIARLVGG